jgi:chromosome segregation ATPase
MTVEDRYKQSVQEVWSLKEQLAVTSEVSRRAQGTCELVKAKMHETEDKLDEERLLKREISSDLTRQYKSMQTQLEVHVHHLEATVTQLRQELAETQSELKAMTAECEDLRRERDEMQLNFKEKITFMESAYESVIHDAMDMMVTKVEEHRKQWETESTELECRNNQILMEFGLSYSQGHFRDQDN